MKTRVLVVAMLAVLGACGSPRQQGSAPPQAGQQASPFPQGSLDQLLAPIALYPDQLLAQILISAGNPAQVLKLDQWLKGMTKVKGTELQDAAVKAGFDASYVVLALFPQVVSQMAADIQWTTRLGQAFTADRGALFEAIQRLRHQAKNVGTLKDTPQQEVSTKTTSKGQDVIVIEPANPQVVYVPQYNTTTVYTQAPTTTTVVVQEEDDSSDAAIAAGLIGFTAGIVIGASMHNHYYSGPYGWYGGAYMYNDAWDDYWDHREDAREDWMDHREDIMEERGDYAENRAENRSDYAQSRAETRTERAEGRTERTGTAQQQRTDRQQNRQETRPQAQAQRQERATEAQSAGTQATASRRTGSYEARGYSEGTARTETQSTARSGGSDAFSGYSSGRSTQAASARGERSRSNSRGGGGGRRR
jgi:hypothetical protein